MGKLKLLKSFYCDFWAGERKGNFGWEIKEYSSCWRISVCFYWGSFCADSGQIRQMILNQQSIVARLGYEESSRIISKKGDRISIKVRIKNIVEELKMPNSENKRKNLLKNLFMLEILLKKKYLNYYIGILI